MREGEYFEVTDREKRGEARINRSKAPTEAEARGDVAALCAELRRERAKQKPVTTSEILFWRHEGHTH